MPGPRISLLRLTGYSQCDMEARRSFISPVITDYRSSEPPLPNAAAFFGRIPPASSVAAMLVEGACGIMLSMTKKIRIIPGFATPNEVAKELGVSKTELRTIDELLNRPTPGNESPQNRSSGFVMRKAAPKKRGSTKRRASKTLWQVVKASKKNARSSAH
jgi:hypothetical protein